MKRGERRPVIEIGNGPKVSVVLETCTVKENDLIRSKVNVKKESRIYSEGAPFRGQGKPSSECQYVRGM